jgi:hypothetical protein
MCADYENAFRRLQLAQRQSHCRNPPVIFVRELRNRWRSRGADQEHQLRDRFQPQYNTPVS